MEIEIHKLTHNDIDYFVKLIKVFEEVFEWENFSFPTISHLQKLLNNDNLLIFIANKEKQLVGGLTAHVLDRYDSEKPTAYIYDLAVMLDQQRKGIGKALVVALNDYCQKADFNEVFVQAETDDIQAVNFYRKTAITSELKATHFTYSFDKDNLQTEQNK